MTPKHPEVRLAVDLPDPAGKKDDSSAPLFFGGKLTDDPITEVFQNYCFEDGGNSKVQRAIFPELTCAISFDCKDKVYYPATMCMSSLCGMVRF